MYQMRAKLAGGEVVEYNDVLQAFFAEGADGSGLVMTFQRQLSAEQPWKGDVSTKDYFNHSYCITLGSEVVIYGGLEKVSFQDFQGSFHFSDQAAAELGIGRQMVVDFEVSERALHLFQHFLKEAVTWGVPSQIPQFEGLSEISIMDALNAQSTESDEGVLGPNQRDGHLKLTFMSPNQVESEEDVNSDAMVPNEPSPDDVAYLSSLKPLQQKICDGLRSLSWFDTDICNFLILFEKNQEEIRLELKKRGQSETEIKKLEELCEKDMTDF